MMSGIPSQTASAPQTGTPGLVTGHTLHGNGAVAPTPAVVPGVVSQPRQPSVSSPMLRNTASPVQELPQQSASASPVTQAVHTPQTSGAPRPPGSLHSMPPALPQGRQFSVPSPLSRNSEPPGPVSHQSPAQRPQHLPQDLPRYRQVAAPKKQHYPRPPDPTVSRQIGIANSGSDVPQPAQPRQPPPPSAASAPAPPNPNGGISCPSPGPDHDAENTKFRDDYYRIFFSIQQSLPESARAAVRENWVKCLLGSTFHQEYVLGNMLRYADSDVVRQTMTSFGSNVVAAAQKELVAHMTTADIDLVADAILAKASDKFLDAALDKRLPTIDAKPLINALARAARLGYEPDDIEDDMAEGNDAPPSAVSAMPASAPAHSVSATLANARKQCSYCNRLFSNENCYHYHTQFGICRQIAPTPYGFSSACADCGQGFSDTEALGYHNRSKACTILGHAETPSAMATQPTAASTSAATTKYPTTASIRQPYVPTARPHMSGQSGLEETSAAARSADVRSDRVVDYNREQRKQTQEPTMYTPDRQRTPLQSFQPSPWQAQLETTPSAIGQKVHVDAYSHLTQQQMIALNDELLAVEDAFTPRFREAELIEDPVQRMQRMEGLKNSFGTKQSTVRRKYGVRLRVRRTKADILAEKQRMGLFSPEEYDNMVYGTKRGRRVARSSDIDALGYLSDPPETEGWPAQRRRLLESTPPQVSYQNGGGVGAASGPAPTASASTPALSASAAHATWAVKNASLAAAANKSDSSEDDDEDIPARLPDDIRQSLGKR